MAPDVTSPMKLFFKMLEQIDNIDTWYFYIDMFSNDFEN